MWQKRRNNDESTLGTRSTSKINIDRYEILILAGLWLLCNLHKIIIVFFSNPGLQTPQDLFSTLYTAAYFAGKDWSAIGQEYSAYYGYGFVSLFSWLYRFVNDGLIIYRVILLCVNLLNVVSCILCYKTAEMFHPPVKKYLLFLICIACTSVVGANEGSITNEQPLRVCVWAVFYLLIKLCDLRMSRRMRIKNTVILGGVLLYGCAVHARASVLYFLVGVCIAVFFIKNKRLLVNLPTILCMGLLYVPYKIGTNGLQIKLLGEINGNSSVIVKAANGVKNGVSWDMIPSFFASIVMYIQEWNVLTGGMAVIGIVAIIYLLCQYGKKRKLDFEHADLFICGGIYSLCGIAAFLVGICFANRSEIYRGITLHMNEYLRYLTLVRYFAPFIAPFLLLVFLLFVGMEQRECRNISLWSLMLLIILNCTFLCFVYPKINHTGWANSIFLPLTWDVEMDKSAVYLVGGVMIPLIWCLLSFWQVRKGNWHVLCILLILFSGELSIYQYRHLTTMSTASKQYYMVDGGYQYLRKHSDKEDIYVVIEGEETEKTTHYFLYQILLPNMCIVPGEPSEEAKLILTNDVSSVSNNQSYGVIQLDDNEWLLERK